MVYLQLSIFDGIIRACEKGRSEAGEGNGTVLSQAAFWKIFRDSFKVQIDYLVLQISSRL